MSRREQGSSAVEFVLVVPIVVAMMLFVVGLGRMAHARQQVESVAADAARAASLQRNTAMSADAAKQAAQRSLGTAGVSCSGLTVNVDLSSYQPGGRVTARVSCKTQLSDVALAGFPGSRTFTASATVPIETWRSQ